MKKISLPHILVMISYQLAKIIMMVRMEKTVPILIRLYVMILDISMELYYASSIYVFAFQSRDQTLFSPVRL